MSDRETGNGPNVEKLRELVARIPSAHLDVWPANRMDPGGEIRLRVGTAVLRVRGRDAEPMARDMLDALAVLAREFEAVS